VHFGDAATLLLAVLSGGVIGNLIAGCFADGEVPP
jgi:hypothetical protein